MPPHSERMSRVDTAWLRMDNDVNLMTIVGVWLLQPGIARAALEERVNDKLLKYQRFRQKVVQDTMGANWVHDEGFDLSHHVVSHKLKKRRGQSERAALQELVGELSTTALDPARPLWQFHLIDDYEGGSALVARVHHCIADGIALIQVLLSLTDTSPTAGHRPPHTPAPEPSSESTAHSLLRGVSRLAEGGLGLVREPSRALGMAAMGAAAAGTLAQMSLLSPDPKTPLKGPLGTSKRAAWSEPIPLPEVKAAGETRH